MDYSCRREEQLEKLEECGGVSKRSTGMARGYFERCDIIFLRIGPI